MSDPLSNPVPRRGAPFRAAARVYRFFRSVRLAVVLILVIAVLSIVATLIPQGKPEEFYRASYAPGLARLVLGVGFDRFARSALYLGAVALFVLNLGVCTVDRIRTRLRSGAAHRHGPDLIHISLLVLAVGGLTTSLVRKERFFTMAVGDAADITGGYRLELLSFDFLRYAGGAPKDWISTVRVTQHSRVIREAFPLEVNRPLRLGLLAVYQTSYDTDALLHLSDSGGAVATLDAGQGIRTGDSIRLFAGAERSQDGAYVALVEEWKGDARISVSRVPAGGSVGGYRVDSVTSSDLTGLTAVWDPGAVPALAALAIGSVGLGLTFLQRRREESR